MQIKKTYKGLQPDLLYNELRDLVLKQGTTLGESRMETYSSPTDSSSFTSRGTLTFKVGEKEGLRVHLVGSAQTETKLLMDIDEKIFTPEKQAALQGDLDFLFGSYE